MNITNLRHQSGGGGTLALFDIEIAPDFRLLNWALKRASDGTWTCFPPSVRGGPLSAKIAFSVQSEITTAAKALYQGGRQAHDRTRD